MRETLARLLTTVTDDDLETLRDAILREEGRRRTTYRLTVKMPFPPLEGEDDHATAISRWARLLAWMAHDLDIPLADGQRGVAIRLGVTSTLHDSALVSILLQEALVEARLLLGRTPEWMTAARLEIEHSDEPSVRIELWDRLIEPSWS